MFRRKKQKEKKAENCCWQTELKEKIWKGKKDGDWDAKTGPTLFVGPYERNRHCHKFEIKRDEI